MSGSTGFVRKRPALFRAMGGADPPKSVCIGGRVYRIHAVLKHDSWAATAIYSGVQGERIICKFNRIEPAFGFPMAWLGRALAVREARFLRRLAHVELVPNELGLVTADGRELRHAVARTYVVGEPFRVPVHEMVRYQHTRRIVLAALITALAIVLVFGRSLQEEAVHDSIEAFGVFMILLGIGGRLWSTLYIGGRKAVQIINTGPYSVTRNPMYFFSSIAAGGAAAQMGSYVATVVIAALCALAFHLVIRREERFLSASMGAEYRDYLARVPRFFPNPLIYRDQAEVTFKPYFLRQALLDGLVFLISIPLFELVEEGQEAGAIPVLFLLH